MSESTPPLNAPCVQVGVDEYGKPYYFKHITQNDSEFVLEVSIDRSGAINRLLHGKYAGKRAEAPAVICGTAGDQVKGNTTIQAGCSCDETALQLVRTNTAQFKIDYCSHIVLLHGLTTETTAGEAAWKGYYTYGKPSGTWYRPLTVNEFETRKYAPIDKQYLQTRYRIDEYHDTLPQEEYSYLGTYRQGAYRLFRVDGTLRESGNYEGDLPMSKTIYDEKGKWLQNVPMDHTNTGLIGQEYRTETSEFGTNKLTTLSDSLNKLGLSAKAQYDAVYYFEVSASGQCVLVGEQILKKKKVNTKQLETIKAEVLKQLSTAKPAMRNGKRVPGMLQLTIKY